MRNARRAVPIVNAAALCACLALGGPVAARAAAPGALTVTLAGMTPGEFVPGVYAYCVPSAQSPSTPGPNRSPEVRWSAGPSGTASYALILSDPDVPAAFPPAGQPIPANAPRVTFYHWVLADVPAATTEIAAGAESNGQAVTPPGPTPHGLRGLNGFGGGRAGYDGPCPPSGDERVHHYHFTVYALDVARLGLSGNFNAAQALAAMQGHVLAQGEAVVTYSLNAAVRKNLGVR